MRRWLVIAVLVLAVVAVTGVVLPAAAANDFGITLARVSPSTVTAGRKAKLETRIHADVAGVATIDVTVTDQASAVVWRKIWSNRTFRRFKTLTYKADWVTPRSLVSGAYLLTVRVLDNSGAPLADARTVGFTVHGVTPPTTPGQNPPANSPPSTIDADVAAFIVLLNDYRREHGLGPLSNQPALTAAASWHSQDMGAKAYFSHTDSLGRDPFQRMAAFGYTAATWKGENIAAGYGSAAQVFAGWKASPGHNANMLNEHYVSIGIGRAVVAGSPYGVYWTTAFGGV